MTQMTPMETLHEIVAAEHTAREEYDKVVRQQEGFNEFLENRTQEMRKEYFDKADAEIAETEKTAVAGADAQIRLLDQTLRSEMDTQRLRFEKNKQALADKIFDLVVGRNGDA